MAARPNQLIPAWVWIALLIAVVAVPVMFSLSVPTSPRTPAPSATPATPEAPARITPETTPPSAPGLGGAGTPAANESERRALESEMEALRIEKSAIETEDARIRVKRDELEQFERDHPNGVPPELYARYEADRAVYNSDVKAFQSRVNVYTMKVAEVERRLEALGPAAP